MFLTNLYYNLRPFVPRVVQIAIRRQIVRHRLPKYTHVWPIDEQAGVTPAGWTGWPDDKKFAFVITHDVETAKGVERCQKLAEIDREHGFRSCFNFVAEDYPIPEGLRASLAADGFEIGVHGLVHRGNLYGSRKKFEQDALKINRYLEEWNTKGFRTPSMFHNLEWIQDLNIEYDSSTFDTDPFEPQPNGLGTIFPKWISTNGNGKGYLELPYTLPQDYMLFVVMGEKNIDTWKRKIDWIAERGGMALLVVHPDYISFDNGPTNSEYPVRYYIEFLRHVTSRYAGQCWHAQPRDVSRFWSNLVKQQSTITLQPSANQFTCSPGLSPGTSIRHRDAGCLGPESSQPSTQHATLSGASARRPLRICMLVYSFYESDNRVMRYAETLVRQGHDVDVVALRKDHLPYVSMLRGVRIIRIQDRIKNEKNQLTYAYRVLRFMVKASMTISREHSREAYNLIHIHNMPDFLVFSTLYSKFRGAKVILDIHDVVPELYASMFASGRKNLLFKLMLHLEKLSCRYADHVIVANHIWSETVVSRSVQKEKCSVVLNYPDPAVFRKKEERKPDGRFIIVYPGSLNYRQGVDTAIKAFALVKDELPTAEFHVYGDGGDKEELQRLVSGFGLNDRVLFKGSLPIYDVAEQMARADLGVEPKRNDLFAGDAMSTKILEFMSVGVPVIASDTRVHKYYFDDTVVRFFRTEDEKDLAKVILEMGRDGDFRKRMSTAGSRFAEDFSWAKKEDEYLRLVYQLTDKSRN